MQKKILMLGASSLQLPAIKKAKEIGYYVGVVDYNPNAIGKQYADEFFNVSTNDTNKVLEIANKFKPNGIITIATDRPIKSVAIVSETLDLFNISYEAAKKSTEKDIMIQVFKEKNIPHPWFFTLSNEKELIKLKDKINYPAIIKPVDSSGSRGVYLINEPSELISGYKYAIKESPSNKLIIQEYLKGKEVSVEVFINEGKAHVLTITDKMTTGAPFFVELGHSQPTQLSLTEEKEVKKVAKKAVEALDIAIGPAHVEIMVTEEGPKLIELGARLGGDYITTHLLPLSTGIDVVEASIKQIMGDPYKITRTINKGSAIRYFNSKPGVIKKITGVEQAKNIPGIIYVELLKKEGDIVNYTESSNDRVGLVIAQSNNVKDAEKLCERALKKIEVVIE